MEIKNFFLNGLASLVQFGKSGGWLQWNSSQFKALASDGVTLAKMQIADGAAPNDAVTLTQLLTKGSVVISVGFSGATPPAVVNNQVVYCTTTGGIYTEGKLYVGRNAAWEEITKADGQPFTFVAQTTSTSQMITLADGTTTNVFYQNHLYLWDVTTSKYLDNGAVSSDSGSTKKAFLPIVFSANNVASDVAQLLAGSVIRKASVIVTTVFDVAPAAFQLKTSVNNTNVLQLSDNAVDFEMAGEYEVTDFILLSVAENVQLTFTNGATPTTGAGYVEIEYYK